MLLPAEFQSHEPEFDYLKSLEIEEKINTVVWGQTSGGNRLLLSTNDKTIKLWKVSLLGQRRAAVSALVELAPLRSTRCAAKSAEPWLWLLCCLQLSWASSLGSMTRQQPRLQQPVEGALA